MRPARARAAEWYTRAALNALAELEALERRPSVRHSSRYWK